MRRKTFIALFVSALLVCSVAWMAFADTHTRFIQGAPQVKAPDSAVFIISNYLDFGDLRTTGPKAVGEVAGVSRAGETISLLSIPAGTYVMAVGIEIIDDTEDSGVTWNAVDIGDSSDTDGWITDMDWGYTASGVSISSGGTTYFVGTATGGAYMAMGAYGNQGKYYSSGDTIVATIPAMSHKTGSGLSDFEIKPFAICIKPGDSKSYKKPAPL